MTEDTYRTLAQESEGDYREKGSKFIAYAKAVYQLEEVKAFLESIKKLHPKARHHCYAYRIGMDKRKNYRANDDGEPSGSAGLPILGQIDSKNLSNIMVIVVRYFGGTKLGVPGLINAYKTSTRAAFDNGELIEKQVMNYYTLSFDYPRMNVVMKLIKKENIQILKQYYEDCCKLDIEVRLGHAERIVTALEKVDIDVKES